MLICANCGNERPEGTRFCGSCGTPFAQAEPQVPPAEPPPTTSPPRKRRLVWVAAAVVAALLLAGGGVAAVVFVTGGEATPTEGLLDSITNTTDVYPTDDATTTSADSAIGQGVDQTCEDLLAFFTLAKEVDIRRGGNSVDGVERISAAASELASEAPAEPAEAGLGLEGEPRESLQDIAESYAMYVALLSELDLDPGPDALLEPRVADAISDIDITVVLGLAPWMDARCSAELLAQVGKLGSG